MKFIRTLFISAVAVLGVSSIDVSAQTDGFSKQAVERKVFKEINKLPYYGVFDNISFKVEGNIVTLYGKVVRPTTKSSAENVVEDIKGVSGVVNNIEVLPLSNFDNQIRYQTLQEFARRGGSLSRYLYEPNPSVRIIVKNGNVSLEGYVANRSDANLANILVNGIFGVFSVENNLVVAKERVG